MSVQGSENLNQFASVPGQFIKMLKQLDQLLVKAAAFADTKKFDVNVLVTARIAPDMHPFARQIQAACDQAKFCVAYLTGKAAPSHADEENNWQELRERIAKTVSYLQTFQPSDFSQSSSVKCAPKWAGGKWMAAGEYVNELAYPNFYFHMSMAYALIRHAGADIGKMDFLGEINLRA